MILLFSQTMEPYLDLQEVLGKREKEGTLVPEEIRVCSKQNRGNSTYISEWCSCWTGRSLRHFMFTGDTGRPGLPGLPGSYTVQVPHRVQKREAGVCLLHVAEPHKKTSTLMHVQLSFITCFLHSFSGNKVVGRRKRDRRQAHGG